MASGAEEVKSEDACRIAHPLLDSPGWRLNRLPNTAFCSCMVFASLHIAGCVAAQPNEAGRGCGFGLKDSDNLPAAAARQTSAGPLCKRRWVDPGKSPTAPAHVSVAGKNTLPRTSQFASKVCGEYCRPDCAMPKGAPLQLRRRPSRRERSRPAAVAAKRCANANHPGEGHRE